MRARASTGIVLCSVVWLGGCQGLSERQRRWLAEGEGAYAQGQDSQAVQQLTRLIDDAPNRPETARARYVRALALARSGQRLQARTDLTRCAEKTADRDLRWRAHAMLGTIDFEDGQWASASRFYTLALEGAPPAPPTDTLLFRLGLSCERGGRWSQARRFFERLVREFPTSELTAVAQRRLQINADHYAVQCGVFASPRNAERMVRDLQRDGVQAYTQTETRGGTPVQVVLVGRFAAYEDALRELARVKGFVPKAVLWP